MKKIVGLSLVCACLLNAQTLELNTIEVVGQGVSTHMNHIGQEDLKSADLADALTRNSASILMIRGSGVANDILLRGQKRDNINVLMDDAKIYGGCPNRMDPAITHIHSDNIESAKIIEGPYDVEHFGTLSGLVAAETKKPHKDFGGEVNLGAGSYGYKKASASASGGNDTIRAILSASTEQSDQYKDGNGDSFYDQVNNAVNAGMGMNGNRYKSTNSDLKAYEKKTFMGKVFINPTDNQEIRLGYTLNRSDNVLYPSRMMDADYDDSDIYTLGYSIYDLGIYSKEVVLEAYKSTVEHPMSNKYRISGTTTSRTINDLNTEVTGAKLKNIMNLGDGELTYGMDLSKRNWDGKKYTYNPTTGVIASIDFTGMPDVDTTNKAAFAHYTKTIDRLNIQMGARYDDTTVKANRYINATTRYENDYDALSANAIVTYKANDNVDYFVGLGKASRVPDAKELYGATAGILDQVTNYETDIGFKTHYDGFGLKGKLFYSSLKDYIHYNADTKKYENVDATLYGATLDAYYDITDELIFNYGMSYLKGRKDNALTGQNDKDLADIVPLRAVTSITYHQGAHMLKTEMVAAKRWSDVDTDNGEQELAGYAVFNLKYNYKVTKAFDITLGVDNLFDKTYAISNTYKDIGLLSSTTIDDAVILMNEPGRYAYVNLHYKF